jgi:hypothetical protein
MVVLSAQRFQKTSFLEPWKPIILESRAGAPCLLPCVRSGYMDFSFPVHGATDGNANASQL